MVSTRTIDRTTRNPKKTSRVVTTVKSPRTIGADGLRKHSIQRTGNHAAKRQIESGKRKGGGLKIVNRTASGTRVTVATGSYTGRHRNRTSRTTTRNNTIIINNTSRGHNRRYEDRHHRDYRGHNRNSHVYRDRHNRLLHRVIYPNYRLGLYYNWGSSYRFSYDYPYYRRRYVFVSLGGYWPTNYRYRRYYWYPSHFYNWYGYYPVAREVQSDTYNYYTYNYYGDDQSGYTDTAYSSDDYATHETYADVREKMAAQEDTGPAAQELSDTYFEAAVKAFEDGDYGKAVDRFAEALRLAPEDKILPFALSQALFADGRYDQAAKVIRTVAKTFEPEKEGIFYPRGLYLDEEVLLKQVDQLANQAELSSMNFDLQLLLGYHLLGIGEIEPSIAQLSKAANAPENVEAAAVLLKLAVKIKTTGDENNSSN